MPEVVERTTSVPTMVDHLFRNRAGQICAYLTRLLGPEHLDLAEEVVQEALLKALQQWPYKGIPDNPSGWLFSVARNAALDAIRHRALTAEKTRQVAADLLGNQRKWMAEDAALDEQLRDDELRLLLMCCHPELPPDARVALSLKTVGGFSVREIARAYLADERTISQRLVRAKRQLREAQIPFELPGGDDLRLRLDSAFESIYLMFNEGYAAHSGDDLVRQDLCSEALRLGSLLASSSVVTPSVHALVAVMAFQAARLPARVDSAGDLVLLDDQDRSLWDRRLIALGFHHFGLCSNGDEISTYHVQAAIAATHASAQEPQSTDWKTILNLYDQLIEINPTPIVLLNRAVALARAHGTEAGLASLAGLAGDHSLKNYYLLPAVQGRMLLDLGQKEEAADCFRRALACPCSEPEQRFLRRKLAECKSDRTDHA